MNILLIISTLATLELLLLKAILHSNTNITEQPISIEDNFLQQK